MESSTLISQSIYALDKPDKKSVDELISQLSLSSSDFSKYREIAAKKIAQLHKGSYSIEDIEYFREQLDVPKENKTVQKAIYKRGRNVMFQRLEPEEESDIEKLCSNYNMSDRVKQAKNKPFNKFLQWYNQFESKHPLVANMAASSMAFTVGDFIAQTISTGNYEFRDLSVMVPLTAYYAWEVPKLLKQVEKIPISHYKTTIREWVNPKLLWKNLKTKKGDIIRNAAMSTYNTFAFIPRHFAALEFKKDLPLEQTIDHLSTGDFYTSGVSMGLAQLPLTIALNHIVLTKVDLQYRFLTMGAINLVWSAAASSLAN